MVMECPDGSVRDGVPVGLLSALSEAIDRSFANISECKATRMQSGFRLRWPAARCEEAFRRAADECRYHFLPASREIPASPHQVSGSRRSPQIRLSPALMRSGSRCSTGASCATGLPCRVMVNRSPLATRSRSEVNCVSASKTSTFSIQPASNHLSRRDIGRGAGHLQPLAQLRRTRPQAYILPACPTPISSTSASIPPTRSARAPSRRTKSPPWRATRACRRWRSPTPPTCSARWSSARPAPPRASSRSSAARSRSPAPTIRACRPTRSCCWRRTRPGSTISSACPRAASWRPIPA